MHLTHKKDMTHDAENRHCYRQQHRLVPATVKHGKVRWRASLIAWGNEKGATPIVICGGAPAYAPQDGDSDDAPMMHDDKQAMIVVGFMVRVSSR